MKRIREKNINTVEYWNNKYGQEYRTNVRKTGIERYKEIIKHINKNSEILDVGSGFGDFAIFMKESNVSFKSYTGFDFSNVSINVARKEMPSHYWILGDVHELTTLKKYNIILCMQTLEHLEEPLKVLRKLYNILDKKGLLIITIPDQLKIVHAEHIWSYTQKKIVEILKDVGFLNIEIKKINNNKNLLCLVKK